MPGYKYTEEECSKMLAALKKLKKHKKYGKINRRKHHRYLNGVGYGKKE